MPDMYISQATPPHCGENSLCVLEAISSPTFSTPVPALSLHFFDNLVVKA